MEPTSNNLIHELMEGTPLQPWPTSKTFARVCLDPRTRVNGRIVAMPLTPDCCYIWMLTRVPVIWRLQRTTDCLMLEILASYRETVRSFCLSAARHGTGPFADSN